MRPHLLVVGGNDSSAVEAARLDIDVTLFQLPRLLSPDQTKAARRVFVFDFEHREETVAFARAVHAVQPFHATVSFWERALLPAAIAGESLRVATNPASAVRLTRDKLAMREALARTPMDAVRFRSCETPAEVARFLADVGGPVVLKPTLGSGSAGVAFVASERDVEHAWQWANGSRLLPLMVEEYVDGPELSIETLSLDGTHQVLGVTEKVTTGPPHFIEIGHRFRAELPPEIEREVHDCVVRVLTSVGHLTGPAHTEVRLTDRGPVLIETQTRFGGDQIWEMVRDVTGVDLTRTTCAHLLGMPLPPPQPKYGGMAIRFFAHEHCQIEGIAGLEAARAEPGVARVDCHLQPGAVLGPLAASKDRQGYVLATGTSAADAWAAASRAMSRIHVTPVPSSARAAT